MNCPRKSLLRMVLVGVACGSYLLTALPAGADVKVYVANFNARTVTVINPVTNTVINNVSVPHATLGIAATPNGKLVYATEPFHNAVNVISTLTDTLVTTIAVGDPTVNLLGLPSLPTASSPMWRLALGACG